MAPARTDPVISVDELMDAPDAYALVDVRWYLDGRSGRDAFAAGHLPGARFCDLDAALASPREPTAGRHPLPDPAAFATALGEIGIANDDHVVAYDDTGGGTAGRLVWMLRAIGQRAAILDGGLRAWTGPLSSENPVFSPVTRSAIEWPATLLQALEALDTLPESAVVLDARTPERYSGAVEPVDPRAGHIPKAANLSWTSLLGSDNKLRQRNELRDAFANVGVESADDLVASCGSGVTACMLLIAAEHAGLGTGRLFVPSFSGWSSSTRDVATT